MGWKIYDVGFMVKLVAPQFFFKLHFLLKSDGTFVWQMWSNSCCNWIDSLGTGFISRL